MKSDDLAGLIEKALDGKRVEPQQRMVGGIYRHAIHRFPIKGGITPREVILSGITQSSALFRRFHGK